MLLQLLVYGSICMADARLSPVIYCCRCCCHWCCPCSSSRCCCCRPHRPLLPLQVSADMRAWCCYDVHHLLEAGAAHLCHTASHAADVQDVCKWAQCRPGPAHMPAACIGRIWCPFYYCAQQAPVLTSRFYSHVSQLEFP